MMTSLGSALPAEIDRVRRLWGQYRDLRGQPGIIVEPQIALMDAAITAGLDAIGSGEIVAMFAAYHRLKAFRE
ncbi:MAG: hypothetical protein BGP16_05395 [Sphingobium sp. 66-54]|nr:MAG: hypothetical protein BGP16_05395 [Sphingobium sp. 66-54]